MGSPRDENKSLFTEKKAMGLTSSADDQFAILFTPENSTIEFIFALHYHRYMGSYWEGFIGRLDGDPLPASLPFHGGELEEGVCASAIRGLNSTTILRGFHTAQSGDTNFGPLGAEDIGWKDVYQHTVIKTWTKDSVIEHLASIAGFCIRPQITVA